MQHFINKVPVTGRDVMLYSKLLGYFDYKLKSSISCRGLERFK